MASNLDQYDPAFDAAGREWNVDPRMLKAIALQESNGNPRAVSKVGAQGLMQIMPATAKGLGMDNAFDPVQSIWGAAKLMNEALRAEDGDVRRALNYYHGGPNWGAHFGPESQGYVPGVESKYAQVTAPTAPVQQAPQPTPKPVAQNTMLDKAAPLSPASEDFLKRTGGAPGGGQSQADRTEEFLKRTGAAPPPPPATMANLPTEGMPGVPADSDTLAGLPPGGNTQTAAAGNAQLPGPRVGKLPPPESPQLAGPRSVARNVAAGELEGAGGVLNFLANPSGSLGSILATGVVTAHDALAPILGYQRFPDDVRQMLLGDQVQQPGSAAINALGRAVPGQSVAPADVPVTNDNDALARKMASGATQMMLFAPGGLVRSGLPGALGAGLGHVIGQSVPTWLQPGAEMATNLAGTGAAYNALNPRAPGPMSGTVMPPQGPTPLPGPRVGGPRPAGQGPTIEGTFEEIPPEGAGAPQPGMGGPQPQAAGTQAAGAQVTPEAAARMSRAEILANRKQAELEVILSDRPQKGDNDVYVPGEQTTLAERAADADISTRERMVRDKAGSAFEPILQHNNEMRLNLFREDMGSAPRIAAEKSDMVRDDQRNSTLVEQQAQPVTTAGILNQWNRVVDSTRFSQRDAVRKVLVPIRDKLLDPVTKQPTTDFMRAWGVWDDIMDKLDHAHLEGRPEGQVYSQLLMMKYSLQRELAAKSNGAFQQLNDVHSGHMQNINRMQLLQDWYNGLTNPKTGMIYFDRFHRKLIDLAVRRGGDLDPAQDIPDSTMMKLIAIDKSLKRANNIYLGQSLGSPTHQLFSIAHAAGVGLTHLAAHYGAHMAAGPIGNIGLKMATDWASQKLSQAQLQKLVNQHIAPGTPGPEWLRPPEAP